MMKRILGIVALGIVAVALSVAALWRRFCGAVYDSLCASGAVR